MVPAIELGSPVVYRPPAKGKVAMHLIIKLAASARVAFYAN